MSQKPFNPLELVARVKTQLRRYTKYNQGDKADETVTEYDFSGLVINSETHKCTLYGKPLALTPIEFSILWHLCQNRGKVVSSEELFEAVWGEKYLDNNNTVMAHVARLRDKMHEPSRRPKFVKTVWGVGGIRLNKQDWARSGSDLARTVFTRFLLRLCCLPAGICCCFSACTSPFPP